MPRFCNKLTKKRKGVGGRPKSTENITQEPSSECSEPTLGKQNTPSASSKKLSSPDFEKYISDNDNDVNEFLNLNILSQILVKVSLCRNCKSSGLQVRSTNVHVGVATQLEIYCSFCNLVEKFYN